jgi:hypothetical protein
MNKILEILASETNGTCYKSFRYCADEKFKIPSLDYHEGQEFTIKRDRYGETDQNGKTKDLSSYAERTKNNAPLFRYFLDGSRRTYKIDDLEINRRIFPIMAGQIGVACCERKNPDEFKCAEMEFSLVISLPTIANPNSSNSMQFFNSLTSKINQTKRVQNTHIDFSKVLSYNSNKQEDGQNFENLGIATIQDEMIECEKKIVANLYKKNLLNDKNYLIKDGSLQYTPIKSSDFKELSKFKNHYRSVIGVSKMFNPELCEDRSGKSNADKIANLGLYHRTPVYMYQSDRVGNVNFAIWYVRIRDIQHTESRFSGVLKIEKILITDDENENGLDSSEVDLITANVINERNPVCYGKDARWANHLYPVFLTESFIKSKYLSDLNFINLF